MLIEDCKTLVDVAKAITTMRQDYADLDAANVKLGSDLIHAWAERDALQKKLDNYVCPDCW